MATDRVRRACVGWTLIAIALALQVGVLWQARNLGGLVVLPHVGLTLLCALFMRTGNGIVAFFATATLFGLVGALGELTRFVNVFTETWGPGRRVGAETVDATLLFAGYLGVLAVHHSVELPRELAELWPRRRVAIHVVALVVGAIAAVAAVARWGDYVPSARSPISIRELAIPWVGAAVLLAVIEVLLHAWLPRRARETGS